MKSLVTRWICLFLLALGASVAGADEIPDDAVITLQRHTCESHCAVYRVVLFGDGTVIYYGQYYVRQKGVVLSHVDREIFQRLIESAKQIDYFNLKSEYGYHDTNGCEYRVPDAPIVSTSVTVGSLSHGVIHHHRCGGAIPTQLTEFEDQIEKLANTMQFTK
jgi:hypothetical protein